MMLLADARLPTGAHTQSAGLEPALRGGMPPGEVPRYIRARLRTVTAVEAGAAVLARARTVEASAAVRAGAGAVQASSDLLGGARSREAAAAALAGARSVEAGTAVPERAGTVEAGSDLLARAEAAVLTAGNGAPDADQPRMFARAAATAEPEDPAADRDEPVAALASALSEVDAAWRARTVSPALRETSVLLGRGYARLVTRLWPTSTAAQALTLMKRPGRAVVLGVAAALAGLAAAQLIRLIGYDDAQTVAAAALKLEPFDPVVATGWVMAAAPDIERMVGDLAASTTIDQMPASGAPLIEQWAQIHATTSQRLFRA